jgi:outer membrane assembly lipoprotein YfiO
MRFLVFKYSILLLVLASLTGCQAFQSKLGKTSLLGKPLAKGLNRGNSIDPDELMDPLGARNTNRLVMQDLGPGQIRTTFATKTARVDRGKADSSYQKGQQLYQQALQTMENDPSGSGHKRMFEESANQFRMAGAFMPDSALEQDALFYEGESYFFADRYVQSNRAFEKLIAKYSGTRYLDDAESKRFAIAQYWQELVRQNNGWMPNVNVNDPSRPAMNVKGEARRILHRIRVDDPTGKLSDDATMALANAYFADKHYLDAADTYEDLRRNYPGSKHVFHATLFELKARMQSYHGDSYDSEPIEKADKLLQMLVNQFPQQSADEEEYLKKEASTIRHLMAQREFSMGQYYEKRGENRAAAMAYQRVARDFGDTTYTDQIEERLASVQGKPPVPEQRAKALVEFLSNDEKPLIASGDTEGKIFR